MGGVEGIDLYQDRDQWSALVTAEETFGIHKIIKNSSVGVQLVATRILPNCFKLTVSFYGCSYIKFLIEHFFIFLSVLSFQPCSRPLVCYLCTFKKIVLFCRIEDR
jgi:hypothetical protein